MYYNINSRSLTDNTPSSLTLSNGTIIVGNNFDIDVLADAGFYTVRNDFPDQPENTTEDIASRTINLDKPYVDIVRNWIPIVIPVPDNISARQIRLWLIKNNIPLSMVDDAIDTIIDPILKDSTRVEWEYAPYIERNHPLINSIAQYLGLNSEQIDQGFIEASQL